MKKLLSLVLAFTVLLGATAGINSTAFAKTSAPSVTKLKAKENAFTVVLTKTKKTDGFQIKCATDKKFKKNVKVITTVKANKTVKKLKGGKTYYVKVRSYKTANGKKKYSKWSAVKKVKVKATPTNLKIVQKELKFSKKHGRNEITTTFSYPEVSGSSAATKKINEALLAKANEWKKENSDLENYYLYNDSRPSIVIRSTTYKVCENTAKYISFLGEENTSLSTVGHFDDHYYSMTFNPKTGQKVTSSSILGLSKAKLNSKVRAEFVKLCNAHPEYFCYELSDYIEKINDEDFDDEGFYLKDGKIYFYSDEGVPLLGGIIDRYVFVSFEY